ncbi:MAG: hypothetical protein A2V84_01685 [Chloroflexi bacterium RBG_16_70_13]|nr:MAG: hypothetical protein A2V84_01685 [Chloroflexi bacterium RBG_16_70_13]
MPRHGPGRRNLIAGAVLAAALGASACTTIADPSPTGSPAAATASSGPTSVPTDVDATPRPTAPSQTDTGWGRIWDALPETFPEFAGASPAETGEGPASAILDVGAVEPAEVADYYQESLESAGFAVTSTGPYEDGSFQIEATAPPGGCAARITIEPLGGVTLITVLYGATCPFN